MPTRMRRLLLSILLAAAVGLYLFGAKGPLQPGESAVDAGKAGLKRSENAVGGKAAPAAPMILEIRQRPPAPSPGDAFETRDWRSAPPPMPVRPAPPSAPPLPFAYLGKKFEDGAWLVFLGSGERVYVLREQDRIDGVYRVDAIRPPEMSITYLPLKQAQTFSIGEAP